MARTYEFKTTERLSGVSVEEATEIAKKLLINAIEQEPTPVGMHEYAWAMDGLGIGGSTAVAVLERMLDRGEARLHNYTIEYPLESDIQVVPAALQDAPNPA
jgi:hypothetical protein